MQAGTAYLDWLHEIFLGTDIYGWFGPIIVLAIFFMILTNRKYKPLGILFLMIEALMTYTYYNLALTTPWYYWNAFIMVIGLIISMFQLVGK